MSVSDALEQYKFCGSTTGTSVVAETASGSSLYAALPAESVANAEPVRVNGSPLSSTRRLRASVRIASHPHSTACHMVTWTQVPLTMKLVRLAELIRVKNEADLAITPPIGRPPPAWQT